MLTVLWRERKRASRIREETEDEDTLLTIRKKASAGHMIRRSDNR